jgi:DDE family transposase
MERELWTALYKLADECDPSPYWELVTFFDHEIVGVFLWAVIHDRPVSWACDPVNWPKGLWKGGLPSQSTMSRRLRTTEVQQLLHAMELQLVSLERGGFVYLVDGKPLTVGSHSKDRDARWGRASTAFAKGYKLHAIYGRGPMPLEWDVAPMNVAEMEVASRMIPRLKAGGGYVLGDKYFDSNPLHALANACGYQLVAQKAKPGKGLGHRRHSPGRLRSMQLLNSDFGQDLYRCRNDIERQFGWLTSHGTGLAPLPAWVRRSHRVRLWVQAKLIAHAMYFYGTHASQLACA